MCVCVQGVQVDILSKKSVKCKMEMSYNLFAQLAGNEKSSNGLKEEKNCPTCLVMNIV